MFERKQQRRAFLRPGKNLLLADFIGGKQSERCARMQVLPVPVTGPLTRAARQEIE